MWLFKNLALLFLALLLIFGGCAIKTSPQTNVKGYLISSAKNEKSKHWAKYAYDHLSSRTKQKDIVSLHQSEIPKKIPKGYQVIYFDISKNGSSDFRIKSDKDILRLYASTDRTAIWLVYQFIEHVAAQDNRFIAPDLPPATLSFSDSIGNFDFSYRAPFFAPNLIPERAPILGTNSVDLDWGLWGHNLSKIINSTKDPSVYALFKGKRTKAQFCFSSPRMLQLISDYIIDNFGFGEKKGYKFMIAPQDNAVVCMDSTCKKLGNTKGNATPAVVYLLENLAKRFPYHQFYTIAYKTTKLPLKNKLPENVGVFLSTISLPKGVALNSHQAATQKFLQRLSIWKEKTKRIYIWDYAANFDDYLTPIPILYGLKKQLSFYKKHGIKGIFLNGSGYDYSSFEGVKTFVSAALLMNTDANVDSLCKLFFKKKYPQSHQLLSSYYLSLEKEFARKQKPYPLYGGMKDILQSYLHPKEFISFYKTLRKEITKTEGEEKKRLKELYTALSFTRLQIAYQEKSQNADRVAKKKDTPEWTEILSRLKAFQDYPEMKDYRETNGSLLDYCQYWEKILAGGYENLLLGQPLHLLSKVNKRNKDISLLHDGLPGLEIDYHQGWFISNRHLKFSFSFENMLGEKELKLRFLIDPRHKFYAPKKIEIKKDNVLIDSLKGDDMKVNNKVAIGSLQIEITAGADFVLEIIPNSIPNSQWGCDEIQIK